MRTGIGFQMPATEGERLVTDSDSIGRQTDTALQTQSLRYSLGDTGRVTAR